MSLKVKAFDLLQEKGRLALIKFSRAVELQACLFLILREPISGLNKDSKLVLYPPFIKIGDSSQ